MKNHYKIASIFFIIILNSCNDQKSTYKDLTESFEKELYLKNNEKTDFEQSLFRIENIVNIESITVKDSLNYYRENWIREWGNDSDIKNEYSSLKNVSEKGKIFIDSLENFLQKDFMKKSVRYDSINNRIISLKENFKQVNEMLKNVTKYKSKIEYFESMDSLKILYNSYDAIFEIKTKYRYGISLLRFHKNYKVTSDNSKIFDSRVVDSTVIKEDYNFSD
jgi:hypothetical protein